MISPYHFFSHNHTLFLILHSFLFSQRLFLWKWSRVTEDSINMHRESNVEAKQRSLSNPQLAEGLKAARSWGEVH